ncbi:MAG: TIGR03087 family PEP-CTERM/XrtA system glycosyltransferase [Planctomycetota bacterium]|nr:MAG: TIGR03087 family PEP-CTERM/XrtA system glycosyltransferase [Planctomycetota bacterium]
MNILYLAHRVPFPPDKGDKIRSYHQLRHLAARHRVWCACFADTAEDAGYAAALSEWCEETAVVRLSRLWGKVRGLRGMAEGRTVTESFYDHPAMWAALRRWSARVRFDVVAAFSSSMAPYALSVPADRRVVDFCDLDSEKWGAYARSSKGPLGWMYRIEADRLAQRERTWAEAVDAVLLITEQEARPLIGLVAPGKVRVIGNGVDCPPSVSAPTVAAAEPVIGFVGAMDYRPNVEAVCWFVQHCWTRVRAAWPRAVFRIVGRSPTRAVRRLARVEGIEVTGAVPDVAPALRGFQVSVAPLRIARGLQNKVLEAMAFARPVVLSPAAAEGIGAEPGRDYLVAAEPEVFAAAVVDLLRDPVRRERIGSAARAFVQRHHAWPDALRRYELVVTGRVEQSAPISETLPVPSRQEVSPSVLSRV